MPEPLLLNVAATERRSVVNGPGVRFVLWVQGCPFRCEGCYNETFLPFVERNQRSVESLADEILGVPGIEGLTLSGGEPMAQPAPLAALARQVRASGLSVFCYTGFTLEALQARRAPAVAALLAEIDILVDGRFEQDRRARLPWRGSANQRVHFLTPRYRHLEEAVARRETACEIIVRPHEMVATGILELEALARLEARLAYPAPIPEERP